MADAPLGRLEQMASVSADLLRESFAADQVVFRIGDPGDSAYVVQTGCIEILADVDGRERRIAMLGEGAFFGEIALLDSLPRTATARAVVPSVLIRISHGHVSELLKRADPVIQYLMQLLLLRFRTTASSVARPQQLVGTASGASNGRSQDTHALALRTLTLAQDLEHGVSAGQLELHYQPICWLSDHAVAGFEALVRWRHPSLGLVSPIEFIPLAEKTGLIHRIGDWVLERAARDWKSLRPFCVCPAPQTPFISVNLSAPECADPGVVEKIEAQLAANSIPPHELRIELTETILVDRIDTLSVTLHALQARGVTIAMDDFGTGYSGLDYLRALPFSSLKIDRAFVQGMDTSLRSMEIVKAALALAKGIGLKTVAEGIEDGDVGRRLGELGCTFAQGYHYGRPLPLEGVAPWYDAYCRTIYRAASKA